MTKYLVLWRLKAEMLPDDPDGMEQAMGMLISNIAKDFADGTLLDWGLFLDGQYGYGIREMEASDLQIWLLSVNQFVEVVDIQEVINFDESQKNIQAVIERML